MLPTQMPGRKEYKMFCDNLKRLIKENGLKQKEVAIRSQCTETEISLYINGKRMPRIKALQRFATMFGCSISELLA